MGPLAQRQDLVQDAQGQPVQEVPQLLMVAHVLRKYSSAPCFAGQAAFGHQPKPLQHGSRVKRKHFNKYMTLQSCELYCIIQCAGSVSHNEGAMSTIPADGLAVCCKDLSQPGY